MDPRSLRIEDYTYDLPNDRIAKYPLEVRDASKLLVYKNGSITEDTYRQLADHILADSLLVFNKTKVIYARLLFKKPTGSTIEVFCLEPHQQYGDIQSAMLQKGKVWWKCMVGGAAKWKEGMQLQLNCAKPAFTLSASIVEKENGVYILDLSWDDDTLTFAEVLHHMGKVPLPPYLNREADNSDAERYQTIFAKEEGSVAAPTAGLHFTEQVLQNLSDKGIDKTFVTLHVGAGTFKPVKSATMQEHDMHAEWIDVTIETIQQLIANIGKQIIPVGTTSLRTVESLYWIGCKMLEKQSVNLEGIAVSQWDPYELAGKVTPTEALQAVIDWMQINGQQRLVTRTQILIAPGYTFRIIKGLVTNFHQPQSTLLLLVAALIGEDWRRVYNYAMEHDYRFLSYGDGCLLFS